MYTDSPGHSAQYTTGAQNQLYLTWPQFTVCYTCTEPVISHLATVYRCTLIRSSTGGSEYSDTSCEGSNIPGNSFS